MIMAAPSSNKRLIIDGDVLVYRCGFAAQQNEVQVYVQTTDGLAYAESFDRVRDARAWCAEQGIEDYDLHTEVHPAPIGHAISNVKNVIDKIAGDLGSDNFVVHLSSTEQVYRYQLATMKEYKGNRDARKPHHYATIRSYIYDRLPCVYAEGVEADDTMLMEANEHDGDAVVVSIDKDLQQNPGLFYDFVAEQLGYIDEESALRNLYQQILSGDSVDNIPGCPGIGDVKAARILAECRTELELFDTTLVQYREQLARKGDEDGNWPYKHWFTGEDMVHTPETMLQENADLVYLLRTQEDEGYVPPDMAL